MARPKRGKPNDLKIHDRRATEFNRGIASHVTPVEISDPYDAEGGTIIVMRQTRDDPLAKMFTHHQISVYQFDGGRAFQRDFETAERGPKAVDFTREAVDGGQMPEPITEAQQKATRSLVVVYRALGQSGSALTHDVLIHRKTMAQVGESRGLIGRRWEEYFGMRFREALDTLAEVYGCAMIKR